MLRLPNGVYQLLLTEKATLEAQLAESEREKLELTAQLEDFKDEIASLHDRLQHYQSESDAEGSTQEELMIVRQQVRLVLSFIILQLEEYQQKFKKASAALRELEETKARLAHMESQAKTSERLTEKVKESETIIKSLRGTKHKITKHSIHEI